MDNFSLLFDKKIWRSLLLILVATLFHKTAIFGLVVVISYYIKLNVKTLTVITSFLLGALMLFKPILNFALRHFNIPYLNKYFGPNSDFHMSTSKFDWLFTFALIILFIVGVLTDIISLHSFPYW